MQQKGWLRPCLQCVGSPRVSTIAVSQVLLVLKLSVPWRIAPKCSTRFDNPSLPCPTIFFFVELNWFCHCSVFIAAYLCLSYSLRLSNLVCHSSLLSLSLLTLYSSLRVLSLSSFSIYYHAAADLSVIYAVHYPCHGSSYEPYLEDR